MTTYRVDPATEARIRCGEELPDAIGNRPLPVKPHVTSIDWRERALIAEARLKRVDELLRRHRDGEGCVTYVAIRDALEA